MTKTSLFRKSIVSLATLIVSVVLAMAFMVAPPVARAEIVGNVSDVGSTFNSSIAGFNTVNDSNESNSIDVGYTVIHRTSYNEAKFGKLPASLDANNDFGYAIIKTSPTADAQDIGIAAGLTSASFGLDKDSFYRISVDVNAQSASNYGGAVVKLTGEEEDIYLMNGNNKFINTNGEWTKYSFFIATSQFEDKTVTISLTLGDTNGVKCIGYAAFDNLEIDLIDYAGFESALSSYNNGNLISSHVEDFRRSTATVEDFNNVSLSVDDEIYAHTVEVDGPYTSKAEGNKAISISNREENVSTYGVVSINKDEPITFNQVTSPETGFYLVTLRTKGVDFNGTASISLNYKSVNSLTDTYKTFSVAAITEETNVCHNDWKTNYFIIKSSVISDNLGYFTVEYGNSSSLCTGSILVDEIEILEINFAEYGKYSSDLTSASVVCDLDSTLEDATGINGAFYQLRTDYYDVLRPNLWSITTDSEQVEYELVSKESTGYTFTKPSLEIDTNNPVGNVVRIASASDTIFTIDSQAVELEASEEVSYYKVTVLAASKNISGAGYATLSLVDTTGTTYAAIKIKGTTEPTLYTFNLKTKDSSSFYIRCTLGDTSYGNKLGGKGELYIARITYARSTVEEYTAKLGHNDSATINFYYDNFNDYTIYNKNDINDIKNAGSFIATLANNSNGTATHGIVELDKVNVKGHEMAATALAEGYPNIPDLDPYLFGGERLNRTYGFAAQNTNATLTISKTFTMQAPTGDETDEENNVSKYYKIIISARAIVVGEHGLTIGIKTTDGENIAAIEKINDTRIEEDGTIIRDQFVDFEFYVQLNDENVIAQIYMTFGGSKHTEKSTGFVLFQGYQIVSISDNAYEKAVENTKDGAKYFDSTTETWKFATTKDLSVKKEAGETTPTTTYNANDTWYLVPSILFAVLLIVAVLGFFTKKIVEKIKEKKEKKAPAEKSKKPAYAKRIDYSALPQEEDKPETASEDSAEEVDGNIDEFDEDYDMYAVHEVKAPTKKTDKAEKSEEAVEETAQEEVVEETTEEQPVEEKVEPAKEKPVSDEFDD